MFFLCVETQMILQIFQKCGLCVDYSFLNKKNKYFFWCAEYLIKNDSFLFMCVYDQKVCVETQFPFNILKLQKKLLVQKKSYDSYDLFLILKHWTSGENSLFLLLFLNVFCENIYSNISLLNPKL